MIVVELDTLQAKVQYLKDHLINANFIGQEPHLILFYLVYMVIQFEQGT